MHNQQSRSASADYALCIVHYELIMPPEPLGNREPVGIESGGETMSQC